MKKPTNLALLFIIFSHVLFSQNSNKIAYEWFDNIVGQKNLDICAGERYLKNYRTLEGHHPFWGEDTFSKAEVRFNNQVYYDVPVKIDLYKDELIAYFLTHIDKYPIILLKDKVTYFNIGQKKFVRLKDYGYLELLAEASTSKLYKKHSKQRSHKVKNDLVHYRFKDRSFYKVYHNGKYVNVTSKRDWRKLFPSQKKRIRTFYGKHRKMLKHNPDVFMTNLFTELTN